MGSRVAVAPQVVAFAVLALLVVACSAPSSSALPPPPPPLPSSLPPPPAGPVPILFVHGHGGTSGMFESMGEHLKTAGYPPEHLLAVDLVPSDGANAEAAEQTIAPAVEELVRRTGGGPADKVDIIAHSMGALSSRWYATRLRPDRIRTLLTVAGANHGTNALCGSDPGSRELCPAFASGRNPVQVGLNGTPGSPVDETPFGRSADTAGVRAVPPDERRAIRYVAVLVPDDQWILPAASGELAGADPVIVLPAGVAVKQTKPGILLFGEPIDHDAILANAQFFVLLDAILADGER